VPWPAVRCRRRGSLGLGPTVITLATLVAGAHIVGGRVTEVRGVFSPPQAAQRRAPATTPRTSGGAGSTSPHTSGGRAAPVHAPWQLRAKRQRAGDETAV